MSVPIQITLWFMALNIVAFLAFAFDKRFAQQNRRRISERTLLWLAFVGGSIGAIAGQQLFRHKTHKEPFRTVLYSIALFQIVGVAIWIVGPDNLLHQFVKTDWNDMSGS